MSIGYNLDPIPESSSLDLKIIQNALETKSLARQIFYYPEVTSTMDIAREKIMEDANNLDGAVILAERQTKAVGRCQSNWLSVPGKNLSFTFILHGKEAHQLSMINMASSLSILKTAQQFGVSDIQLKWPNDIKVGTRKLAGILCDHICFNPSHFISMVGIGININERLSDFGSEQVEKTITTMYELLGHVVSRELFFSSIFNHLQALIELPQDILLAKYRESEMLLGKPIMIFPKEIGKQIEPKKAKAIDISNEGLLIVQLEDGSLTELVSQQVTIRLDPTF